MKKSVLIIFILSIHFSPLAQSKIQGRILKQSDSLPLSGVSVYYDGTSIGASTGDNGFFQISSPASKNVALIINALGYKTVIKQNLQNGKSLEYIYLEESQEDLDVVYLEFDPWSRKKKLDIFRREFLGKIPAALESKITNEEVIKLRFIPSTETLVAIAEKPLKIINRHLGYEITYDLKEFTAQFSSGTNGLQYVRMVYYEGFTFFEELRKRPRKKFIKNREKTFYGSGLHFMRSLASQTLAENGFRIFYDKFEVLPYSYFEITPENGLTKVKVWKDSLSILYGRLEQSELHAVDIFYIDSTGNVTPAQNVMFSGEISLSRLAGMLPLDYKL